MSDYGSFLEGLANRESSGDQHAINNLGYLGLYQMGEAALVDAGYVERRRKPDSQGSVLICNHNFIINLIIGLIWCSQYFGYLKNGWLCPLSARFR